MHIPRTNSALSDARCVKIQDQELSEVFNPVDHSYSRKGEEDPVIREELNVLMSMQ